MIWFINAVFMAPSSHFAAATLPGFAFSVNFPLLRTDSTLEIVQSGNLEVKDKGNL
jgi:hypothetical protein